MQSEFKVGISSVKVYDAFAAALRAAQESPRQQFIFSGIYCPRHQATVTITAPLLTHASDPDRIFIIGTASCGCDMDVVVTEKSTTPAFTDADVC